MVRRVIRTSTSRGAHIRALHAALSALADVYDGPSHKRVAIRDHLAALERAYPFLRLTESDVAQAVAEEDDETIDA